MFCKNCGKQLGPETRFCPACGTKAVEVAETSYKQSSVSGEPGPTVTGSLPYGTQQGEWSNTNQLIRKLLRPRSPRMLGGVCAAFALHYGWNLDAVRIVTAIASLFYGIGVLAYIACWIIIPEAQYALPAQSR